MNSILLRDGADRVGFRLSTHSPIIPVPSQRVGSSSLILNTRATTLSSLQKSLSAASLELRQTGDPSRPDFAAKARRARADETSAPIASRAEFATASSPQPSAPRSSLPVRPPEP